MNFLKRACKYRRIEPKTELERVLRTYSWAGSDEVLNIVLDNWPVLREAGLLEEAFIEAWSTQKWGSAHWTARTVGDLLELMDRKALLAVGDPLPPGDSFTLYRGVAGVRGLRRVRGHSWSGDKEIAKFFAEARANRFSLPNPAVYEGIIAREHVLAYLGANHRDEKEFLVIPRRFSRIEKVWPIRARV
jgi:hypothetical protein